MKSLKIAFALLVGVLAAGCYNDFDTPGPRKLYTDDDMTQLGLQQVSIKTVKGWFTDAFGGISGTGTNNNGWENTKTLKFGDLTPTSRSSSASRGVPMLLTSISKARSSAATVRGNIYKSLYIYDGTAAIELKLYNGLYLDYLLDLDKMESQWVYVRLDGLYLGNYRMMLSIGGAPSDGINTAGTHKYYANSNLDNPRVAKLNVFPGEYVKLEASDILEVNSSNYTTALGEDQLGRLVRFNGVKIRYAGIPNQDDVTNPPMLNGHVRESLSDLDRDRLGIAPLRRMVPLGLQRE